MRRVLQRVALGGIALLVLIQLVPYGRAHEDPHATRETRFYKASAQRLFDAACSDCHSDHTS
jgi:mono/diheme cytochrome c family protein